MARSPQYGGLHASVWAAAELLWREPGMFTRMKEVEIESVGIHVTELVQGFEVKHIL